MIFFLGRGSLFCFLSCYLFLSVDITKRIGASSKDTIAPTILQQLNQGILQTATLSECLAVDFAALMHHLFPTIPTQAIAQLNQAKNLGITKRTSSAIPPSR
jgi:hypothetical protein